MRFIKRLFIVFIGMASISLFANDTGNLSFGFDFTHGESQFGLPIESTVDVQTYQLSWEQRQWSFSASIPYTEIKGPAVFLGAIPVNALVRLNPERRLLFLRLLGVTSLQELVGARSSGVSDISITADYYFSDDYLDDYSLSLIFGLKLANGDENKGLGTGATDISFGVDWQYFFENFVPGLSLGYVKTGRSNTFDSENYSYYQVSGNYLATETLSFQANYYQGILDLDDDIKQIEYGVDYIFNDNLSLSFSIIFGDSDSAFDESTKVSFFYSF